MEYEMEPGVGRKILIVDDDANLLASVRRRLCRRFEIRTALSAEDALDLIRREEPFAVVVTDQCMGQMNGIRFLTNVKRMAPDTVRMMLTGNATIEVALDAINEAEAFRFLTKPCSVGDLSRNIEDALAEHDASKRGEVSKAA